MATRRNLLNDLTGKEWLFWTDTLYVTSFPIDPTHGLRKAHGAMKPPELMAEMIRFFTKQGQLVLDPFAGVGGTLIGAALTGRKSVGCEINPEWVGIYERIAREYAVHNGMIRSKEQLAGAEGCYPIDGAMHEGDCLQFMPLMTPESVDAVITDPPYGCDHETGGFSGETNFNMFNRQDEQDFGNSRSFPEFYDRMGEFARQTHRLLKPGGYLVMIIGDRYRNGEYIPLGVRVAERVRAHGFELKGIKIWCNKATQRPLKPYAVFSSFVPNITHQNILILRKSQPGKKQINKRGRSG